MSIEKFETITGCKAHDLVQKSEEWSEFRAQYITGSILSKLITPAKLNISKSSVGLLKDVAHARVTKEYTQVDLSYNQHINRGVLMEQMILNMQKKDIEKIIGKDIEAVPVEIFTNEEHDLFAFSPDAVYLDGTLPLAYIGEVKSLGGKAFMEVYKNGVPGDHNLQVQLGLFLSGADRGFYTAHCMHMGVHHTIEVGPDILIQKKLKEIEEEIENQVWNEMKEIKSAMRNLSLTNIL